MKELNQTEWQILLNRFVADAEEMRPVLMKPFEQDGYVCATDTHVLLRVAKKFISEDYSTGKTTPNVARVVPEYKPLCAVTASNLRSAFSKRGIDYNELFVNCPHCDSENEVEWKFVDRDGDTHSMWAECPCCNGTGDVPNGINQYIEINDCIVNAHFMLILYQTMIELGIDKAEVSFGKMHQLLFTIADGIDIVMMSHNLDNKRSKGVTKLAITKI